MARNSKSFGSSANNHARSCDMLKKTCWTLILIVVAVLQLSGPQTVHSQGGRALTPEQIAQRNAIETELQALAIVERKLMIPMRDGTRIATDVYRPKDASKKYPTIFVRTPYNFNFWDIRNGVPR